MRTKLMTVMAIIAMLAVAFLPIAASINASADDIAEPDAETEIRAALVDAGYTFIERDGKEYVVIAGEEVEFEALFSPLGVFLLGLVIGIAIGVFLGKTIWKTSDMSGITNEDIFKIMRSGEANRLQAAFNTALGIAVGVLPADAKLWKFTTNYWQRAVEYYVAEFWEEGTSLDMVDALIGIDFYRNVANYLYSWSETLDTAYNTYLKLPTSTAPNWTQPALNSMDVRIVWDNGSISGGTPITSSYKLWSDIAQLIYTSAGHNLACIDTDPPAGSGVTQWYDTLYFFGSGTTNIKNVLSGNTYRLNSGANNVNTIYCISTSSTGKIPSGVYEFENGKKIAGPIVSAGTDDAAPVQGTLVFGNTSSLYYALSAKGDTTVGIYGSNGALVRNSAYLKYAVNYVGPDGNSTAESLIFGADTSNPQVTFNLIGDYDALIASIDTVFYNVSQAAQATWEVFDILEASNSVISPSSMRSMAGNIPMSAAEYVATTIQMMIQTHDAVVASWDNIESGRVNINPESLALYCYGNIYKSGILWAENVVFTPYINNTDQKLVIGSNTWKGTGYAMIWWQGENLSSWGGSSSLSQYTYVALDRNTTIEIKNIIRNHTNVSSVELTRDAIIKFKPEEILPNPPPTPPVVDDHLIQTLVQIIVVLVTLLLFMVLAYISEDDFVIPLIIALIVGVILWFCTGTITDLITGNFHWTWPSLW